VIFILFYNTNIFCQKQKIILDNHENISKLHQKTFFMKKKILNYIQKVNFLR